MADQQDQLRVLLVGNGGREHALAWKLSQSARIERQVASQVHASRLDLSTQSRDGESKNW